jgi:beta-lactamase class A
MRSTKSVSLKKSVGFMVAVAALAVFSASGAGAAKMEKYDIIYLRTPDLEKVLDYKDDLETVFDDNILKKIKIVSQGDEYALIYDGNLAARTVTKILIKHAELLSKAGFNEPWATKEQNFRSLYNVSYGMGRNLEPLKEKYQMLYSCLGEEVKQDLFIEQTDFGNYILVYRLRRDEQTAIEVAKKQAALLKAKKIATSLAKANNNTIVYGESSLINDGAPEKPGLCKLPESFSPVPGGPRIADVAGAARDVPPAPAKIDPPATQKTQATAKSGKNLPAERSTVISAGHSRMEESIADYIDRLKAKGIIDNDEVTGWMVYDLENDHSLASINADVEFQAASMIKPFVALAFFHQVKAGKLTYDGKSKRQMEAMIQRSSNSATNFLMRRAGGPAQCDAILKRYYGHIFKKTDIKEYIPADGRTYLNSAPPVEYVKFLRALWNMDMPYSQEIRRVMALPGRDRLYYGTSIPQGTLVYNKTGTTARLCGDMGILVTKTRKGKAYPYVIVGIIERKTKASDYGQWMAARGRVIRNVSTLVYEELKRDHQLL